MLSLLFALAAPAADMRPVFQYRRTNGDGSEAEDIYVFAEAPGRIAVMKEKSRCTNAAYVTPEIDPASGAAGNGTLWFDARSGVLLEARLPLANHSEYRDFRLRLIRTTYGAASWKAKLADHWRGCPPADG